MPSPNQRRSASSPSRRQPAEHRKAETPSKVDKPYLEFGVQTPKVPTIKAKKEDEHQSLRVYAPIAIAVISCLVAIVAYQLLPFSMLSSTVSPPSAPGPCPPGQTVNPFSKSAKAVCIQCPVGRFSKNGGPCLPCPVGTATSARGSSQCTPCVAGEYADVAGLGRCDSCPAGTVSAVGASSCTPCAAGSKSGGAESGSCAKCEVGKYSDLPRASMCTPCPAGSYGGATGLTSCAPCARLDVPVGGVSDASRRNAGRSAAGPGGPRRATRVGRITELVRRSELFRL